MMRVYDIKKVLKVIAIIVIIFIITINILSKIFSKLAKEVISETKTVYKILVDVENSKLFLFENGSLVKEYMCSGGKWNTPSPIGKWKIIQKAKWGEGFGGSFMGLNVPWGNFGIHGTLDPSSLGWSSSHGCIRMKNEEVEEIYKIVPIGTEVVIVDGVYGPFGRGFRNLKSGMYGSDVLEIQKKLKELGFFKGNPNGKFGAQTENAVKEYCKANELIQRKTIDIELQKHMGFELID